MEKVISTLIWAALIQGVLLAVLYLFSQKYRSLANRLLGLLLLVIVYEGIIAFLPYDDFGGYQLYYFALPEVKLFYPLLFLHYILEKVGRTARYEKFLRFHYFAAFAIAALSLINIALFLFASRQMEDYLGKATVEIAFMVQQYYAFALIIVIFIISIVEVRRYKKVVRGEYSDYEMLNINWLLRLIFAVFPIIVVWGLDLVRIALGLNDGFSFELVTWGFVVLFIYFVSFEAFKHKNLFEGVAGGPETAEAIEKTKQHPNSATPVFGQAEDEEIILQIKTHMEAREPYLDPALSIYQLSRQVNVPVRDLSLLINHRLDKHFFDFVNEYRIKKAMELLQDPQHSKTTVLGILYEVGFNSKSSFNTVFKKYTGKTPTEYRKTGA